jgi:ribonuclease HI
VYRAFTDGGAEPNPGPGGWGLVVVDPHGGTEEHWGGEANTTNNRMELTAAIAALEHVPTGVLLEIVTDSRYVQRGVTEWLAGWRRRGFARADGPLANADLWRRLDQALGATTVRWSWIKGHAGHEHNERADELATRGRRELVGDLIAATAPSPAPAGSRAFLKVGTDRRGGWWCAAIETPDAEPQILQGRLDGASSNRCDIASALEVLAATCGPLVISTGSDYLRHGATQWLSGWKARGWQTKDGKPVANADLWRQLDRAMAGRQLDWPKVDAEAAVRIKALVAMRRAS